MWKNKNISLGDIKVGQKQTITFEFEGNIVISKDAWGKDDIRTSCGCTSAKFSPDTKTLTVSYTPKDIPKHLEQKGRKSYQSVKSVIVYYKEDGLTRKDTLIFNAKVIK